MRAILAGLLAFGSLFSVPLVSAQTPSTEEGYSLQPAVGDYLKIDRRTGDVFHCTARDGAWSCQLIPEDRKAYEDRISELEAENDRLAKQVAALEAQDKNARAPLLDKEDERHLQEFLDLSDRMFRHFFDLVDRLRQRGEGPI